ncbi:uncharacterized protein K441DRAFT_666609 [Cenococcum geophilum 1.58]|uniref:uncharacterized protein n=1 Tax=Cenococcum geophilum 1.58 TaxID=794803 RepID=UPI00358E5A7E|nr:hypothetical protein K441DRAFT_666609 [Cenococcum geophilum 1.58]
MKLAAAGFYHLISGDYEDNVECAFCGVQIYNWDDIDHPIEDATGLNEAKTSCM